jgi:sterol desaturase/sphingolipid hydroxylase (fatty acid hydroxylase superfamily)
MPLYGYEKHRLHRALPNIALTVLLVATNLALSVVTGSVANFANSMRLGLFFLFSLPSWLTTLFGIMALDLFTYFAHVLMHKTSLGWRFHRVHHSDKEVNVTTAFRQHPGETIWRILWYVLAIATFGIPPWVVVVYLVVLNTSGSCAAFTFGDSEHAQGPSLARTDRNRLKLFQHLLDLG